MEAVCEVCQGTFEAKRRTARFCSSNCRVRSHRGAQVVPLKAQPGKAPAGKSEDAASPVSVGSVEAAAVAQLEEADRLNSVMGQAALVLARRLDQGPADTGSAVAAIVKQLELTLDAATAGANVAEDPVDELRRRRDRKLGVG